MNTNEETRLRNLLLKKGEGKKLSPLDVLYIKKLSVKKAAETSTDKMKKAPA